jgi:hypothetical protein
MMTPARKSVKNITTRALRKCTQFYADGVHARCTPQEYLTLCWYFDASPQDYNYYLERVKKGEGRLGNHYIHVKQWNDADAFQVHKYALLDCSMSQPY